MAQWLTRWAHNANGHGSIDALLPLLAGEPWGVPGTGHWNSNTRLCIGFREISEAELGSLRTGHKYHHRQRWKLPITALGILRSGHRDSHGQG